MILIPELINYALNGKKETLKQFKTVHDLKDGIPTFDNKDEFIRLVEYLQAEIEELELMKLNLKKDLCLRLSIDRQLMALAGKDLGEQVITNALTFGRMLEECAPGVLNEKVLYGEGEE